MLGNIDKRKFHYAIKFFKLLNSKMTQGLEIHIYGHPLNTSMTKVLNDYSFVSSMGFKNEIRFKEYDLLLSCSFIENLPISILEALQHRLPVLSFDIGGISELLEHERDGILVPPFDLAKMKEELINIISGKYEFTFPREKLKTFDWETSAKLMLEKMRAYFHA